jgi:prepilin-type N-terminal cleavage/methylation domain-containing protein
MKTRRGATLIELLVAIAMMAMLMTALLSFVFSMTEIWGQGGEKRLFEQHVNAVTRHLESMMRRAALPTAGLESEEAFSFQQVSSRRVAKLNGLTFVLPSGDRLMQWNGSPAPFAEATVGVDSQQGLMLYWRSQLEEEEDEWREVAVTPFVEAMRFVYFDVDTERWSTESSPQRNREGLWRVPERLILLFEHGDFEAERTITLPLFIGGQPIL